MKLNIYINIVIIRNDIINVIKWYIFVDVDVDVYFIRPRWVLQISNKIWKHKEATKSIIVLDSDSSSNWSPIIKEYCIASMIQLIDHCYRRKIQSVLERQKGRDNSIITPT